MALSIEQLRILAIVERCASVLSIVGIVVIIGTFSFSRHFRNPIHRVILINAFYNLFDVAATTISLSGPEAGNGSALCQFQGFALQMFPLADVLWTLAMACDVFLVVFYYYGIADLRRLEKKYVGVITVLTSIPAVVFLFICTSERGSMYGSVTLWCSIAPNWVLFRIVFFYGPIWVIILIVMVLYCLIGIEILKQRHKLKSASNNLTRITILSAINGSSGSLNNPAAPAVEINVLQPIHVIESRGRDELIFASSSKCSITQNSTSNLPPSEGIGLHYMSPNGSPVSFKQYILMPLMFFIVLLAVWVAPTINRVAAFVNPNFVSYPLLLAVGSMSSLRGFWNGVVFIAIGIKGYKRPKNCIRENILLARQTK